ncbi:MAG: hypothetical protein ACRDDX_10425 [Cellulosilyticaceae bacterium]
MIQLGDYRLEQDEPTPLLICDGCCADIYLGESYYKIDGENICDDCLKEYMKRYKEVAG